MGTLEARKLRQFILQQDQTSRYILLLHYYDNLTTKEIGLVLDLSELSVNKRLAHLKQQAQQQLDTCQVPLASTVIATKLSAIA